LAVLDRQHWNDIFNFKEPLDPNLVKALIATESSFRVDPPGTKARGLMQLMPETFGYLNNTKELKEHFIEIKKKENYLDPSANICAGVRWLFRKKVTAGALLKRDADWIEAVADYIRSKS
jgi:soluble lytic murein transglycosylase-like protein